MNLTLMQPLFIIGLQKSGTTLLNRLLVEQTDVIFSPFKLEGREFWGDDPPFNPNQKPCGEIYQSHNGENGHFANFNDYKDSYKNLLFSRLEKIEIKAPILINKNPYNSVRISWLKAIFPECKIVAMVRDPYANIFSLLKKHIPHKNRGLGPVDGWWGVKPKNWENIISKNLVIQLSKQWREINKEIINNHMLIDLIIDYRSLCNNPNLYLSSILNLYGKNLKFNTSSLTCMDDEYKKGSRLLSKNRLYQQSKDLRLTKADSNKIELQPLSPLE